MNKLKSGYTTGSSALAASKCAATLLLYNLETNCAKIKTPLNKELIIDTYEVQINDGIASCFVYKDGGDDLDATHGLKIYAYVKKIDKGIVLKGGQGVGIVTKKGLKVAINEPAINPVPRQMIYKQIQELMDKYHYQGGLEIEIVVPDGEKAALKTFNSRLGIIGGISILGTTGIVEPMSQRALVETIKVEIDYFINNTPDNIMVLTPGNYGQDFTNKQIGLDIENALKYSNFLGDTLDYAKTSHVKRILLISHVGKLVKVAGAIMNTHSQYADGRNEIYTAHAAINKVDYESLNEIMYASTSMEINEILDKVNKKEVVYQSISKAIQNKIDYRTKKDIQVEFIGFSLEDGILIKSSKADEFIQELKEQ